MTIIDAKDKFIPKTPIKQVTSPRIYKVSIQGSDPLIFDRPLTNPLDQQKNIATNQSGKKAYDKELANWRDKLHVYPNIGVVIPAENFHEALIAGSKYWKAKVPGKGNTQYSTLVQKGIICSYIPLNLDKDDSDYIRPFEKYVRRKDGQMVVTIRPIIWPWEGTCEVTVYDEHIDIDTLATIVEYTGVYNHIGNWRKYYGSFHCTGIEEITSKGAKQAV